MQREREHIPIEQSAQVQEGLSLRTEKIDRGIVHDLWLIDDVRALFQDELELGALLRGDSETLSLVAMGKLPSVEEGEDRDRAVSMFVGRVQTMRGELGQVLSPIAILGSDMLDAKAVERWWIRCLQEHRHDLHVDTLSFQITDEEPADMPATLRQLGFAPKKSDEDGAKVMLWPKNRVNA